MNLNHEVRTPPIDNKNWSSWFTSLHLITSSLRSGVYTEFSVLSPRNKRRKFIMGVKLGVQLQTTITYRLGWFFFAKYSLVLYREIAGVFSSL